jgi:DNA-binding NtrC family response regulator
VEPRPNVISSDSRNSEKSVHDGDPEDSRDGLKGRILVVDDEPLALKNLRRILERAGHKVSTFASPLSALKRLEEEAFDLIISDIRMPYMDGMELLNRAKRLVPGIEVILVTGYASLDGAVEATKKGAFHYLAKPFTPEQVRSLVRQALGEKFLKEESSRPHDQGQRDPLAPVVIGKSLSMVRVEAVIRQIAPTDCNVLITGESGTGKELVAHAIHAHSARARGPFVAFNCGAFTEELVANELFGHEKEAFTGASSRRPGLLEAGNGGTLFLDEIGDMPLSTQVKLLRVIQEREIIRVGGTKPTPLDIRILAATAKDLKAAVTEGVFRQDLYFRLNVVNILLPSLAERREDIPLLAYHILDKCSRSTKKKVKAVSREAMGLLKDYAFPGNVRELENILERAVAMCQDEMIQVSDLPPDLSELALYSYRRTGEKILSLGELEKDYIRHVLDLTGGVRTRAAEILGIDRASLWRKMKKYDMG